MSVLQASGELVVLLGRVRADLARAAELAAATTGLECLSGQSDETLLAVVVEGEAAARQLGCVQASAAAILDDRSSYAAGSSGLSARYGHNRASYMLEDIARISNSEATRRVKVGAAMRSHLTMTGESVPAQYPAIGAAIETGDISVDCAARIMTGLDAARKHHREGDPATEMVWDDSFRAAETHLVDASTTTSPDLLQVQIVQWREALDPDGAQPREEEIRSRRGFRQGRERNGITRNTWDTTGEDTARIKAAIAESDAAATPRFVCTDDAVNTDEAEQLKTHGVALADPEHTARLLTTNQLDIPTSTPTSTGEVGCADHSTTGARRFRGTATITAPVDPTTTGVVTATTDLRSREQRHCDVMSGLFMAGLRASKNETGDARSTIEVTAVVTAADLEAGVGVGWLDGINEPVSLSTIEELACTDGIRPVLLGRSGEVLYLGPKPR
ncbi:DUF222 domain-containing protein, partial [Glaciihabitans tibetensis]|uniref:DUF222 domain-containing protein n=1 Tax=Glaciihabitans tibetensis TaxID=1266600 RepID=UPI0011B28AE0